MIIESKIKGVVSQSAHPAGCYEAVRHQIEVVQDSRQIMRGPKKVLVLGASSGFGLASRIALSFGGAKSDTIGVSFERGPSEKGVGSAGWYNNIFFKEAAEKAGLVAKNFIGDAFSYTLRNEVIAYIKNEFGGKIDLLVYSLATGIRPDPVTGDIWRSALKPIGAPYSGYTFNIEKETMDAVTLEPATPAEIESTIKVMGGEDWENWVDILAEAGVLNDGFQTVAYSYVGTKSTYRIYHEGTLGKAKAHLHFTADQLDKKLQSIGGHAYVAVCKALITKASVFIPAFSEYILALFKVMKKMGLHEGCIEQMQRLFAEKMYDDQPQAAVDSERLIRVDDWEMRADVQAATDQILSQMTIDNFKELGDYNGYLNDFMQLNGFCFDHVDYDKDISFEYLQSLKP